MRSVDKLRFTRWFEEDLSQALAWYESKSLILGDQFRDEVERVLDSIEASPERFAFAYQKLSVRYVMLHRFPYWTLYHMDESMPIVIGIKHCASDSMKWISRLEDS
jgi:hypothetical protein